MIGLYKKIALLEERISKELLLPMVETLVRAQVLNLYDDSGSQEGVGDTSVDLIKGSRNSVWLSKRYLSTLAELCFSTDTEGSADRLKGLNAALDEVTVNGGKPMSPSEV